MTDSLKRPDRKALGAYYTDEAVVRFLVAWGAARGARTLMDPACGDGRFLAAARDVGFSRLIGCDVSTDAIWSAKQRLHGSTTAEFHGVDFFALHPHKTGPVDLIAGNPPFVRYQRFEKASKRLALASAARAGTNLSGLTSTWAPFLFHSLHFLAKGGSLAMVVPAEIIRSNYGIKTLRGLLEHFGEIHLLAFENNFFGPIQTETCLILASNRGARTDFITLKPMTDIGQLCSDGTISRAAPAVEVSVREERVVRFAEAFLTPQQRKVWRRIKRLPEVKTLASLGVIVNGYVTGDNDFFHRRRVHAEAGGIPATWLLPTARSSRSLLGLFFSRSDIENLEESGQAHHLLFPEDNLFTINTPALAQLTEDGQNRGVHRRFKCRRRDPWWRVRGLQHADLLVAYMSGTAPRVCVNQARAYFSNSLHGLQLRCDLPAEAVAVSLHSSLSLLSMEIEGRSYGGGVLKLEPRELDRVLAPIPSAQIVNCVELANDLDVLLRRGERQAATDRVDDLVLRRGIGLSERDILSIRNARELLRRRRLDR